MPRIAILVGLMLSGSAHAAPCDGRGTSLVVDVKERTLFLCTGGEAEARYPVALGRGGTGKRSEGDNRTPLGSYRIGAPRPSTRFGTFVPVGYPSDDQRRRGFTGGDVGVHGPDRRFRWAGRLATLTDWTRGCIAVASDAAMSELVAWLRRERPPLIHIL